MNFEFIELNQNAYTLIGMCLVIALSLFWYIWCRERVYILGVFATCIVSIFLFVLSGAFLFEFGDPLMTSIAINAGFKKESANYEYVRSGFFDVNNPIAWKVLPTLDPDWMDDEDCVLAINSKLFGRKYYKEDKNGGDASSIYTYSYTYWPYVSSFITKHSPEKWIKKEYLVDELINAKEENKAKKLIGLLTHIDKEWRKSKTGILVGKKILQKSNNTRLDKYERKNALKIFKSLELMWYEVKAIRYGVVESIVDVEQRYTVTVKSSNDVKNIYADIIATSLKQGNKVGRSQVIGYTTNRYYVPTTLDFKE